MLIFKIIFVGVFYSYLKVKTYKLLIKFIFFRIVLFVDIVVSYQAVKMTCNIKYISIRKQYKLICFKTTIIFLYLCRYSINRQNYFTNVILTLFEVSKILCFNL